MQFKHVFKSFWHNRSLIAELTKREFSIRYSGSFGGFIWSFIQPLFLLAVYTVAFGIILKSRWGFSGSTSDYAFMLFAGLIIFNTFSEVLNKSPTLVITNQNFVKKIVFPLELLPIVTVITALLHACIGITVWLFGYALFFGQLKITIILFPIILICLTPLLLGLGWLLSSLGVIVRDISQLTGMISQTLLFLTPIFYSIDAAPPLLKNLLKINPLTFIVEQLRLVLFYGKMPLLKDISIYFITTSIFAWLSLLLFRRLRPIFSDLV